MTENELECKKFTFSSSKLISKTFEDIYKRIIMQMSIFWFIKKQYYW